MADDSSVEIFTLTNVQGTRVRVAEYGALLVSIETADRNGELGNITLSYQNLDQALAGGVYGSVIGRFANRINTGGFSIDGKRFELDSINSKTGIHTHGGKSGFHHQLWTGTVEEHPSEAVVSLTLTSLDGHEGYPGDVRVKVTYRLTNKNILEIDYQGNTDQPTHLNLTNHAFFNLAGKGDIREHFLTLTSDHVLEFDQRKIPTGKMLPVESTWFDFRNGKLVGLGIEEIPGGGYDHCYPLPPLPEANEPASFAKLIDAESGRSMEIATTMPGVQIYTANHLKGNPFPRWGGICFETQFYPDTPNRPEFPSSLLRPGENYHHLTTFQFDVIK